MFQKKLLVHPQNGTHKIKDGLETGLLFCFLPTLFWPFRTHNVCAQLNKEDGDAAKRKRDTGGDVDQVGGQFWDVLGQGISDGFLEIVKDQAPWGGKKQREKCRNGFLLCVVPWVCEDNLSQNLPTKRSS